MRIVYLGTPDFSVEPLKRIYESKKYEIVAVITNPDRPFGRKQIMTACPVKKYALSVGLKVLEYEKIRNEGVEDLKSLAPDLMITCAFGQILSQEILDIPKIAVINLHASILPKYRGASPIHFAILNGETETGITVMKTDIGIDTGDIMFSEKIAIKKEETCGELFERLSLLAGDCVIKALSLIESGKAEYHKQDENLSTITKMIRKEFALIDFNDTALYNCNKVRAFNPSPVAYFFHNDEKIMVYSAKPLDLFGKIGEVLECDKRLVIACKDGAISIETLKKAGGNKMDVNSFLRGNKFVKGEILTNG